MPEVMSRGRCGECGRGVLIASPDSNLPRHQRKGGEFCDGAGKVPVEVREEPVRAGSKPATKTPKDRVFPVRVVRKARRKPGTNPRKTKLVEAFDEPRDWDDGMKRPRFVSGGLPGLGKRR